MKIGLRQIILYVSVNKLFYMCLVTCCYICYTVTDTKIKRKGDRGSVNQTRTIKGI